MKIATVSDEPDSTPARITASIVSSNDDRTPSRRFCRRDFVSMAQLEVVARECSGQKMAWLAGCEEWAWMSDPNTHKRLFLHDRHRAQTEGITLVIGWQFSVLPPTLSTLPLDLPSASPTRNPRPSKHSSWVPTMSCSRIPLSRCTAQGTSFQSPSVAYPPPVSRFQSHVCRPRHQECSVTIRIAEKDRSEEEGCTRWIILTRWDQDRPGGFQR